MTNVTKIVCCVFLCAVFCVSAAEAIAEDAAGPAKSETQLKLEKKAEEAKKIEEKKETAAKAKREAAEKAKAKLEAEIAELNLPQDTTPRLTVRQVRISGNTLISTDELLEDVPGIYNASDKPMHLAESQYLYDLRALQDIIMYPGEPRQVSTRAIQGFTQYVLSVYQKKNYGGIYVYVPAEALAEGRKLEGEILPVRVLEASVSKVAITHYNPQNEKVEKGYLRTSAVSSWSPLKIGEVANQKELDDFVNLLNLNPDRYVSAVISKGIEPDTLAVEYNIYEANPWHYFLQADNSGTRDRQWTPRSGVINTNLFGIDDTFTAIYQAPWESGIKDNYSLYGSYDFPLLGPRLRLNVYGGYSEYDISPEVGTVDFVGNGNFLGGKLRYNAFQADGWFFDVTGSLERVRSKVTPSLFPDFLGTDLRLWTCGYGLEMHRSDDMSNTALAFNRVDSMDGGSDQSEFSLARTNADEDFTIYTASALHRQYLDTDKVQRLSGSLRWISPDKRLIPAKMNIFGGMYTVRGYDEYEIIADGGLLASAQYEFDLVKYDLSKQTPEVRQMQQAERPFVRKLAPLAFLDYGLAKIEGPRSATEHEDRELCSLGTGVAVELGDNFSGVVYYGYPLIPTDNTRTGKGRLNIGLMLRF